MKRGNNVKRLILILLTFCLLFAGCAETGAGEIPITEEVPVDYGKVIEIAKEEFYDLFSEFSDLKITETSTSARTDDGRHIIVEIKYSSENGSGAYGFENLKDDHGNFELLSRGEDVGTDNFTK